MKTLYDKNALQEILTRVAKLTPETKALWGKMSIDQMLVHIGMTLEMATGLRRSKQGLMGRILGPFFKKDYLSEKPFSKNSPTNPDFVITGSHDFKQEKEKVVNLLKQFSEGGPSKATKDPHGFFGKLSGEQWGEVQFKHLDHHLRQFGA